MSAQVPVAFGEKFKDDFLLLSQQRGSKLMGSVRTDPDMLAGRAGHFDRIGATVAQKKTTRHGDTPLINTPHSRRKFTLEEYEWADMIDRGDIVRLMKNPENRYVQNATWAMGRTKDDIIIAAANGNSISEDEDGAGTTVALPAAQKIVAGGGGMTLAKVLGANERLIGADVDEDEERFAAIGEKQVTDLLNITEVKSADYSTKKALNDGHPARLLGFTWIPITRLTVDSSSDRLCLFWARSALGFAADETPFTDIGPRRDKSLGTQVYMSEMLAATRIEDEKLVQVACVEA